MGKVGAGARAAGDQPLAAWASACQLCRQAWTCRGSSDRPDSVPARSAGLRILPVAAAPALVTTPGQVRVPTGRAARRELGACSPFLPFRDESEETEILAHICNLV